MVALSLVCLSSVAGGCSWLFTQPLPEQYSRYELPTCSTNRLPPVLDTIFTVTNTASAIYVASRPNVANKESAVTLGLSVALLWGFSASYGYRHTAECEDAQQGRFRPVWRAPPPGAASYGSPRPRPATSPAPAPPSGVPVQNPAPPSGAPIQTPAPPAPPAPQQQDDDDPDTRRPRQPRQPTPPPWGPNV